MKRQRVRKSVCLAAVFLLVAVFIHPIKMAGFSCEERPAIRKVLQMNYSSERETMPTKSCLCGRAYRLPDAFILLEAPLLTVLSVCSDCAHKLRYGSFAERNSTASQLARKAMRNEVAL